MTKIERPVVEHEAIPSLRWAILQFPGTWSEMDNQHQLHLLGQQSDILLASMGEFPDVDSYEGVIVPGGFAQGDYLRTGAIAALHPVMEGVKRITDEGKPVIGICNGFQILCEAGILQGALIRNTNGRFNCNPEVYLRVEQTDSLFTKNLQVGQVLKVPISHGEGSFQMLAKDVDSVEKQGLVVFRYCDIDGNITDAANPNGSLHNIAGIMNPAGNVLGMMPHPERACEAIIGGTDGNFLMMSAIKSYKKTI